MNLIVVLSALVSWTGAASISEDAQAEITAYDFQNNGDGNYEFRFETSNGISRKEMGTLVNVGEPNEHLELQGIFSYTNPEGKLVIVRYTAGEHGYHITNINPLVPSVESAIPPAAVASLLG